MNIAIGCDHRGLELKKSVIELLTLAGHHYEDFGSFTKDPVDYPDFAEKVARAVADGHFDRGILVCDTGIGMCIAANKVPGIRAAMCYNVFCACRARQHTDVNVLCLGAQQDRAQVPEIVSAFLTCNFDGGRHEHRINKIKAMESR